MKVLLDTTILVYAVGDEHPLREPCRQMLQLHADGRLHATTTAEVIQEFMHVRSRRSSRADAVALGRNYVDALPLISATGDDLVDGLELYSRQPDLGAFDSLLAAVALNHNIDALASADKAFGSIASLPWIDPAHTDIAQVMDTFHESV